MNEELVLAIEQLRLGERLRVAWRLAEPLPWRMPIPSLVLQPLLENAIKHGLAPGRIAVDADAADGRLRVRLSNTLPPKTLNRPGTGTGLANVRARLAAIYGSRAWLDAGPEGSVFRAVLDLPLQPPSR